MDNDLIVLDVKNGNHAENLMLENERNCLALLRCFVDHGFSTVKMNDFVVVAHVSTCEMKEYQGLADGLNFFARVLDEQVNFA